MFKSLVDLNPFAWPAVDFIMPVNLDPGPKQKLSVIREEKTYHRHTARRTPKVVEVPLLVCTVIPPANKYSPHQGKREIERRRNRK